MSSPSRHDLEKSDFKVDYTRILVPQYHPEIVPSRKTRESNNSLLQSHDGLKFRSSSEQDLVNLPRRFDYAKLEFHHFPSERDGDAKSEVKGQDYVNIEEECDSPFPSLPVVTDIKGSYVNLKVSRPSEMSQRRSSRLSSSGSPPPPQPSHQLARWQSERLHASTKPITGSLHLPIHDYQNLRHKKSAHSPAVAPQPTVIRVRSFQRPAGVKGCPPPQRNPTTGEYQNMQHQYDSDSSQCVSDNELSPVLRLASTRCQRRSHSEVRGQSDMRKIFRKTHVLSGPPDHQRAHSQPSPPIQDYHNLWYLSPDPDTILESCNGYTSGEGDDKPHLRYNSSHKGRKDSLYRRSVGSLVSDGGGDYSYDRLLPLERSTSCSTPRHDGWKYPSDSEQADVSSLSSYETRYSDHIGYLRRPCSTPPTSHAQELHVQRRSLHQLPPPLPRRSSEKIPNSQAKGTSSKDADHLGLFKVHYLGQHPTDRFTGEIDHCFKKVMDCPHWTAKEVFVYVTTSVLRLTPPNTDLLFASFAVEHILTIECSTKKKTVVGVVFKRSKAKCVCHLFECGDDLTSKIFVKTVKEALVSIREQDMITLKNRASDIEQSSVVPVDLFGPVKYVGSCRIVPGEVITKTITGALTEQLKPSEMTPVTVNMKSTKDKRNGVLVLCENDSTSPLMTWYMADVEMVGCLVDDKRFVGLQLLDEIQTVHILHFGQAVGAVAFFAVLRDKFGVTIDQGEFSNPRRQLSSSWKQMEPSSAQKLAKPGGKKSTPVNKKLSFKNLICSISK